MTTTSLPCLLDIFTFSTLDDGTTQIFQRYAKETDGGVIASYVAQIKDGKISFVTQRPPAALVDFGRFAAAMVADESWPHPHRLDTRTGEAMSDPRSDEHKYPEGDMNANPTRPFYVDTDLSHYVVREQATGKSLTKRCTFDEADHACNLLNYGWRACAKAMSDTAKKAGPPKCSECGVYAADHKGVCEGCLAYREHQQ